MRTVGRFIRTLAAIAIVAYVGYKVYKFISKGGKFVGYDRGDGLSADYIMDRLRGAAARIRKRL